MISFFVVGSPAPKGSTKSFPFHRAGGGLGVSTTNANPRTKDWQNRVATEAQRAYEKSGELMTGPVEVSLIFHLTRPKSVSVKKRPEHITKPDLDKLSRAVIDGLTGTVIEDDCQVIGLFASKHYAELSKAPGCFIIVQEVL